MSFVFDIAGAQQSKQIGQYNQSIQERNAQVAEQQAEQIDKQKEFDIAQFDKEFVKLEGSQRVASAKAGIGFSGTALRIQRANAKEAQLQREIIEYNSKVAKSQALERANMFRVQGQMARQQARMAQLQTITSTGTSLLTMSSGSPFGTKPQSDIYSQANLSFAGSRG